MEQNEDTTRFEQIFKLMDTENKNEVSKESLEVLCTSIGLDITLVQDITTIDLQGFANLFATFSLHQPTYDNEFKILANGEGKIDMKNLVEAVTRIGMVPREEVVQMIGHLKIDMNQEIESQKFIREELKK
ncbi:hypothetical protein SS50377_20820 [Spironucleus salmonicida]|uniref:EF-hand domain-containing protein n=1 Tax=Spironucleus salmonicida TaxID=348837 RepID=V6LG28_9EUKA|nr:hypothetical protein SS50377_20820 [Spironucleus salmonicida]|eukprot:EST43510.1 hypothetical protein SS50377_16545 [Spironucleus salmonicida]